MGDLRDLLRAALEDNDEGKGALSEIKKIHEDAFGKDKARLVYNASIEWTCHEFFAYAMNVCGHKKDNLEAARKAARLIAELRDTLIANGEYDSTKMPNINYFRSLNECKEPE